MSDSVRPHRQEPTRLPGPWDSSGKNTGVSCQFLLQCKKVKTENEAAQSCPTFSDPMDCSLPGSSIHGSFQARVLDWDAIAFSCCVCICCQIKKKKLLPRPGSRSFHFDFLMNFIISWYSWFVIIKFRVKEIEWLVQSYINNVIETDHA